MTIAELLAELKKADVALSVTEDDLVVRGKKQSLSAEMLTQLREHKRDLIDHLRTSEEPLSVAESGSSDSSQPLIELTAAEMEQIAACAPGGADNVQDIYPLTPLQEGILFHHLMASEGDPYLTVWNCSFESRDRLDRYMNALQAVADRHDILRTAVLWEGLAAPVQVVLRRAPLRIEEVELNAEDDAAEQLWKRFDPRHVRMDVRQAPLLRLYFACDRRNDRWVMLQLLHHLAGDHTTMEVMRSEVQAHLLGQANRLPAPVPFRNLVAQARRGISQQEHEAFFRQMLGDVDEPTAPFGLLDVQGDGSGIEEAKLPVDEVLARRLRSNARRLGVSAASLCHLAWAQVLAKVSGRQDVVFGTVLFGRMQGDKGFDRLMGLSLNTLPVRICIGEERVDVSVRRMHALLAELLRHEHASLALAQRCSGVPAPAPLFTSLLNYRHSPGATKTPQASEGMRVLRAEERTNYPVVLSVNDLGEGFSFNAQVPASIGPLRICEMMCSALSSIVESLETAPATAIATLDVVPESERRRVLYEWNNTDAEFPAEKCVHQLFEEQVRRTPDATAVVFEDESLSYDELNRRANRLAHYLRKLGVKPDARVAICVERSLEMLVGLMAILKAGGAYVPLDPAYPVERLRFMLEDAQPIALLTQPHLQGMFSGSGTNLPILDVTAPAPAWMNQLDTNPDTDDIGLKPQHLAYIIYTSGSTGQPKGVMVEHGNVARLFTATDAWFGFGPNDVWTLFHSYAFDFSVWEIWGALLYGGRLVVVAKETAQSPRAFYRLLCQQGVTVLNQTPSAFRQLIAAQSDSRESHRLRYVVFGGEALEVATLKPWYEQNHEQPTQLINMYGITETTVHVTFRPLQPSDTERYGASPIGCRIPDLRTYILDAHGQPVPVGVAGELYVGGAGVARGYLNRLELTAQRFLPDPISAEPGARMYRTGDLARWLADGNIEYLGRNDFQVKIRGFRIELGEIEARLAEHPAVREAAVIAREDTPGDKRLVAYYTTAAGQDAPGAEQLRSHLAASLPEYMVPAAYVWLQALPLTPNGKLDRKALPAPDVGAFSARSYEPPQGEMEERLATVWAEVLKVDRVGRHDNFFDLGGHSLTAFRVISAIKRELNIELPIRILFQAQSVSQIAAIISDRCSLDNPHSLDEWPVCIPIHPAGSKLPLFCVARPNVNALGYLFLSRRMGPDQPVYGLQRQLAEDPVVNFTQDQIVETAKDYIGAMQAVQPRGPYLLIGQCQGAYIAFEMTRQLERQGERVAMLGMLDVWPEENTRYKSLFFAQQAANALWTLVRQGKRKGTNAEAIPPGNANHAKGKANTPARGTSSEDSLWQTYWPGSDFKPTVVSAKIVVFRAPAQPLYRIRDKTMGWGKRTTGPVKVEEIPADHLTMLREPSVRTLAERLAIHVEQATERCQGVDDLRPGRECVLR